MQEILGADLFDYWKSGQPIIITTNGFVKKDGNAVMGRGVAVQATGRMPQLPRLLGEHILLAGNVPMYIKGFRVITLPVKHNWWEKADLDLIIKSTGIVKQMISSLGIDEIYMPRPGCGNGQLDWEDVKPHLEDMLDERFVVVEKYP